MKAGIYFLLIVLLYACAPKDNQSAANSTMSWSPEKKALYASWRHTQFYYDAPPFGIFLVNRNDTMQEEFIKNNGMLVEFDITWQSDSTYSLAYKRVAENPQNTPLPDGMDTLVRTCWMTKVSDLSYVEAATTNLASARDTIYTTYKRPEKKLGPLLPQ